MSDWENDDEPVAPPPKVPTAGGRKKFDDEDVEDEVKDDWEEEDSEPEQKPAAVLPPKKKKTVKQKIAEKEEEERRRREEGEDDEEEESEDWDETPADRRRREKEAQLKSDVDNAATLFGASRISDGDDTLSKLRSSNPSSKEDWEAFSNLIFDELIKKHAAKPGFEKHFAPHLMRNLCGPLRDVDIRKASTKLKEYAEEKVKAEKEAKKTGGQKKSAAAKPKTVGTASAKNIIDTKAYGDEALDDDLDFM